ncbi:sigma-54-dependent Fis family transcriptional regulator [Vibrio anguillarum]|uniref:Sigma-54-dependent Fis family transcriptional regulator n=2 Tax=Vibrio anguillarum TaxID=55601 RepID=A0AAW4AWH8_VIBAN|nr:Transcriptional regulator [Vibrio anguillarum 775]AGU59528.1 ATPase AAA [Vibrio anguillarum M3]ASF93367.1 AAA family ATPase [Vibrio anguillarum]ATA51629.1 AAA family ATPase [Vibrio anguillarum]AUB86385.1 AAA family ATPase [Vibrio anguillarum]
MIMSHWLAYATELVVARKPSQLAALFVETLRRELRLDTCLLLVPSSDGRTLVPQDNPLNLSWSVTDFDCPFAHVLQSAKSMHLTADELVFWQSNRLFSQLTSRVGMLDSVVVHPLPNGDTQVQSILLLIGETHTLEGLFEQPDFIKYVDVFCHQWSLLNEMQREEQNRQSLSESLSDVQRDNARRSLIASLSETLIGNSLAMKKLREQIINAAPSQLSVMVQGETGTGKELVAQAVHQLSPRKQAPFVAINCAAIPENLLESELFGYCKGAFSGADSDKQGLIAQADGGTLFLDEIGDMPLSLQAKLLRVLESRSFRPIGGKNEQSSDFRLVSATHVNLLEQVRNKSFRQDLYYRLFQYPITLPRLAARMDDIERLSQHFVRSFNQQHATNIRGVHYKAIDCLKRYDFPGNVRELKHLIEFGCAQTLDGTQVEESCFTQRLAYTKADQQPETERHGHKVAKAEPGVSRVVDDLKQAVNEFESRIIRERLQYFAGDRAKAAQSLGIPKRTLAYKCQKLEIKTP